jgi:hypothetical protein
MADSQTLPHTRENFGGRGGEVRQFSSSDPTPIQERGMSEKVVGGQGGLVSTDPTSHRGAQSEKVVRAKADWFPGPSLTRGTEQEGGEVRRTPASDLLPTRGQSEKVRGVMADYPPDLPHTEGTQSEGRWWGKGRT